MDLEAREDDHETRPLLGRTPAASGFPNRKVTRKDWPVAINSNGDADGKQWIAHVGEATCSELGRRELATVAAKQKARFASQGSQSNSPPMRRL